MSPHLTLPAAEDDRPPPPDVFQFSHAPEGGVFYVTAGLTGESGQKPNSVGNYELAIALREPADWAPDLISKLGLYSLQAVLEPTATMDVTGAFPKGSTLNSLVFLEHTTEKTRFKIGGRTCCILLAQGLTEKELNVFRSKDRQKFVDAAE